MNDKAQSLDELMAADAGASGEVDLPSSDKVTDLMSLVTRHRNLEEEIAELDKKLKSKNAELRQLSTVEIPEVFTQMGNIQKFTLDNGVNISVKPDLAVSIKKGQEKQCFEFLEQHQLGAVIKSNFNLVYGKDEQSEIDDTRKLLLQHDLEFSEKRAVHASTLKSTIRKLTEQGTAVPESFNYFPFHKTVIK